MPDLRIACFSQTLELISIEEQQLTEVYGGGGGGKIFNGHGQVVFQPVQSRNRQKQTVWFKDAKGRETSRTLYDVDLQGRPGHRFVEYWLESPGRDSKPLQYVNQNTGSAHHVYSIYDLGLEWRLLQRPWEPHGGHMLVGAVLGWIVNFPFALLLMQMAEGLGMLSMALGGPILGAIGFPMWRSSRINDERIEAYRRFEKAVNDAWANVRHIN